jgi:perosamine synthetase
VPPSNTFVPPTRPTFPSDDRAAITKLIEESLVSGSLALGPNTERLEESFATRHQVPHAVAVSSGSAALEIALRTLADRDGTGRDLAGRTVVVPANTFFATAAAVIRAGGVPRFADIDPLTFALSPATVEPVLDDGCAGVVIVHVAGFVSPDTTVLADLCGAGGLWLLEDAAGAHGASFAGRPAGSIGDAGAFSFSPTKIITSAEGGMVTTAAERCRDEARLYRDQGRAGAGADHARLGSAWRMSELHAAVGLVQLARLDEFIEVRRRIARLYDEALEAVPGITPVLAPEGSQPNYDRYLAVLDEGIDRDAVRRRLREEHDVGLPAEVYARPLHRQPVFAGVGAGPLPVTDDLSARHVCLPVHNDMTDAEAEQVIDGLRSVLARLAS